MLRPVVSAVSLAVGLMAAGAASAETIVVKWDSVALQAIRDTHPGPPIVARALAIVHTCIYDAWAAYDDDAIGTRRGGALRRPPADRTLANKEKAVSYAAYRALVDLFPSEKAKFDMVMAGLGHDPLDVSTSLATPAGVGNVACKAVLDFRHNDGSNQLGNLAPGAYADYTGYAPVNTPTVVNDPNRWQPLQVGATVQKFITPHWGKVTPFALTKASQFRPGPPQPFGSKAYVEQAKEVLSYSAMLNDEQKVIAEYWADGPSSELPPGHWALFAQFVSQRDSHDVDRDAKMFFAMTNAILDASIASWEAKRFYDYVRPVTAIHVLFNNQQVNAWAGPGLGTQPILGQNWRPYQAASVVTPPFAEYISGHSIFSAAGAEVLKRFTGSDVFGHAVTVPAFSSAVEPGIAPTHDVRLTWATFSDAADEAGISRRYGGIHFKQGDVVSREAGRLVGRQAWEKAKSYFDPRGRRGDDHGHGHDRD